MMTDLINKESHEIFEKKIRQLFYECMDNKKIYEIEMEDRMKALSRFFAFSLIALRKEDFKDSGELAFSFSFVHSICLKALIQLMVKFDEYSVDTIKKVVHIFKETILEDYEKVDDLIKEAMIDEATSDCV